MMPLNSLRFGRATVNTSDYIKRNDPNAEIYPQVIGAAFRERLEKLADTTNLTLGFEAEEQSSSCISNPFPVFWTVDVSVAGKKSETVTAFEMSDVVELGLQKAEELEKS